MTSSVPEIKPHKTSTTITDPKSFHRMVWQRRIYWVATWARWIAILLVVPEVMEVILLHFPLWADLAVPVTLFIHEVARWIQNRTKMWVDDIL